MHSLSIVEYAAAAAMGYFGSQKEEQIQKIQNRAINRITFDGFEFRMQKSNTYFTSVAIGSIEYHLLELKIGAASINLVSFGFLPYSFAVWSVWGDELIFYFLQRPRQIQRQESNVCSLHHFIEWSFRSINDNNDTNATLIYFCFFNWITYIRRSRWMRIYWFFNWRSEEMNTTTM